MKVTHNHIQGTTGPSQSEHCCTAAPNVDEFGVGFKLPEEIILDDKAHACMSWRRPLRPPGGVARRLAPSGIAGFRPMGLRDHENVRLVHELVCIRTLGFVSVWVRGKECLSIPYYRRAISRELASTATCCGERCLRSSKRWREDRTGAEGSERSTKPLTPIEADWHILSTGVLGWDHFMRLEEQWRERWQ